MNLLESNSEPEFAVQIQKKLSKYGGFFEADLNKANFIVGLALFESLINDGIFDRDNYTESAAFPHLAFHLNLALVGPRYLIRNCQTEAGPAFRARPRLVNPVKAFEDQRQVFRSNSDTCVCDGYNCHIFLFDKSGRYVTPIWREFNRI